MQQQTKAVTPSVPGFRFPAWQTELENLCALAGCSLPHTSLLWSLRDSIATACVFAPFHGHMCATTHLCGTKIVFCRGVLPVTSMGKRECTCSLDQAQMSLTWSQGRHTFYKTDAVHVPVSVHPAPHNTFINPQAKASAHAGEEAVCMNTSKGSCSCAQAEDCAHGQQLGGIHVGSSSRQWQW